MDGKALQSQPCGPGRGPFQYDPLSSPPTRPDAVVGEGPYVNVNVHGNVYGNVDVNVNRNRNVNQNQNMNVNQNQNMNQNVNVNASHSGCIKDGRKSPQQNHSAGMLHHQVSDKLQICDDEDVKVSQTRTSTPTHQTETEPLERITEDNGGIRKKEPFDICPPKQGGGDVLKITRQVNNRERIPGVVLRSGMVLLKSYISVSDQVKIVKRCRELGMGCGGFYHPGYGDGTKLHLKMMCLGRNWYPLTSQYGHQRPSDGSYPPHIPPEFLRFVRAAIHDSHSFIQQHSKTPNSDSNLLPFISPDICIVNFYSQNGRLGIHQDKDESEESIRGGLPVVSFSIGDSAVFSYGDKQDGHKKIVLESGDVLIFGGKSRNIFHGITAIRQMTAPDSLLQQTNLRPGRLNLTFRKY